MRIRYNASWVTAEIEGREASSFSRLVGEMERAMTFRLGERGIVEEDIPVGCPEHPNFDITCPACRRVFNERNRVRPFFLTFPSGGQEIYTLKIPTGLVGYLLEKDFHLPPLYRSGLQEVRRRCAAVLERFRKSGEVIVLTDNPAHREAVENALNHERAIVKGIPGAGKTWVALSIIANLRKDARICWLTHTRALLSQTTERMRSQFKEPIGTIGEGEVNTRERITVAMFQTLYTRLKENDPNILRYVSTVDVLIIDEFHHIAATTFFTVSQAFNHAYIRYGLSATPFREIRKENFLLYGGLSHSLVTIDVQPTPIHLDKR